MSFKGVAYLTSRWIIRQPTWLFQSVMFMLGFIVIMYAWGGVEGLRNLIIAWLIMGGWSTGINLIAQEIGWSRVGRTLHMYIASSITPFSYILGSFISSMMFLGVELVVVGFMAYMLGFFTELLVGLLLSIPLIFISMLLGIAIVMKLREGVNVSAITNPIANIFSILPPVLYPAKLVPSQVVVLGIAIPLRKIALLVPTATAAELARQLAGLGVSESLTYVATVFATWIIISIVIALYAIKWGHE
ncbi:hypothetical protein J4526_06870 [Desulfurococcaceae archaeon MEX13E-LK6-19]|nr:hypothetical protein J4526_06870 [Desulfurococcaceae archaeon MEX13E-LK6-19]